MDTSLWANRSCFQGVSVDDWFFVVVCIFLFVPSVYVLYYATVHRGKDSEKSNLFCGKRIGIFWLLLLPADTDRIVDIYDWSVCRDDDIYPGIVRLCV